MGKKKVPKSQTGVPLEQEAGQAKGEFKGKKTYSLDKKETETDETTNLPKVQLPDRLEQALTEIILENKKAVKVLGDISKRITAKKLTDVYNSLSTAGFSKNQIEAAMSNTIMCGGDLIDALDWLCLNTQNDQLPTGFSETLHQEEEKRRPKFDLSLQVDAKAAPSTASIVEKTVQQKPLEEIKKTATSVKDWILQYADNSSSEEEEEDKKEEEAVFDPTSRYAELYGQMQDLKDQAAIAKSTGAVDQQKQLSKQLKAVILEMASLEQHPEFNPSIKADLRPSSSSNHSVKQTKAEDATKQMKAEDATKQTTAAAQSDQENGDFGLHLLEELGKQHVAQPSVVEKVQEDVRSFEYTRSQWTGKSPKQFLIDWVRKHLSRSGPPKFQKHQVKVNRFKCTAAVDRQKDGMLTVTPSILCENVKDAEHLAATLALYHLCRGQPVHQLLPPPYRNVWLEWAEEEKKEKDEAKDKENKPRDQFISRLIKKLNIDSSATSASTSTSAADMGGQNGDDDDVEDNWENWSDKNELKETAPNVLKEKRKLKQRSLPGMLQKAVHKCHENPEFQELLKSRQQLPVFQFRDKVMAAVRENSVIVIAGETGSGKSTQVPQFILEDCAERGENFVNIVCTQPRRISTMSLSTRVSQEMGQQGVDHNEALVGYQIRFESRRGPNTRLLYCTTGVMLRQLQSETALSGVSHLIIDEVHERNVQSDFLMIVVKDILRRRSDLKVILMSATLDSEKISSYFQHCPVVNVPGRTFPVEEYYLEDVIEMTGYVVDDDSPYTVNQRYLLQEESASVEVTKHGGQKSKKNLEWTQEDISKIDQTDLPADKYSLKTRNAVTRLNLNRVNLDLIVDLLKHLESSAPFSDIEGAVLIFLPGLADIQELYEILTTQRHFSNPSKYKIFALHSVISSQDQGQVFVVPPPGVRKVVLATNIAETGITIPDVAFVIDSGKAKENRYLETSWMSVLEEVFISKASCKQRAGRAGRVREGFCFRLFTHEQFRGFRPYTTPEMLRVPLEELCLSIMKCQYGKPHEFLSGALDPPQELAVSRAMTLLKEVGACQSDDCSLTPLGHHLAALPVDVRIGKMLILAAIFGCLEQIAVVAAAMTEKSPFVVPLSKRSEADAAKEALSVAFSDHITLYKAYQGWYSARRESRSAENSYLSKYFLKRSTLLDIENVKNDLMRLVRSIGFDNQTEETTFRSSTKVPPAPGQVLSISTVCTRTDDLDMANVAMMKAILTAGLYPQVGQVVSVPSVDITRKTECMVETPQGVAQVHPFSVNKHLTSTRSWLVYHEKIRLSRVYLRDTTVVSPYALLLFGGAIDVQHTQRVVSLDNWIKFKAVAKTGVIFKEVRILLADLLERKLQEPSLNILGSHLVSLLKELIKSEKTR
ncbi:hypothetical protein BsWGS_26527 [Bradybaena similaris]